MGILNGEILEAGQRVERESATPILNDSFEGNAQSFRIVDRIAARKWAERGFGLNLTYRTLAAIQKYPWLKGQAPEQYKALTNSKWGAYRSESRHLEKSLEVAADDGVMGAHRSLEADIMDWADDISYAVHDTEDFFRAGIVPLDVLFNNTGAWDEFLEYARASIAAQG